MLRPIKRDQQTSVISILDEAIDMDRSPRSDDGEMLAYAQERLENPSCWRERLTFVDGETPTEFVIGIIPSSTMNRIDDECREHDAVQPRNERFWRCFLAGVRDIVGGFDDSVPKETIEGVSYVKASWLRYHFVGHLRQVGLEIGAVIWSWNRLSGDDRKN